MGRLKETVTRGRTWRPGARSASAAGFVRCTPGNPCPICGREKFCSIGEVAVVCTSVSEGAVRTDSNAAGEFYVHMLDGAAVARKPAPTRSQPSAERAAPDVRDRAYRALLAQLTLNTEDREALLARGLSPEVIEANGYRTLPVQGRSRFALVVQNAVGEDLARGVPGIVWKTEGNRSWWSFGGSAGLVVPCRDLEGRIVSLKVRQRGECDPANRYTYVSSKSSGGPSAELALHVPDAARAMRGVGTRLAITEGELKADICTAIARSPVPVVSVPGIGAWAAGVDLACAWGGLRDVDVCFDMDRLTNKHVADAAKLTVSELRREGFNAVLRRWDKRFKGLDDFLAARSRGEV